MNKTKIGWTLLSGWLAGLLIGTGGTVYLAAPNKTVGAVLFAVGLLTICTYGMKLFTGAIGYLLTVRDAPLAVRLGTAAVIWLGNLGGTVTAGLLVAATRPMLAQKAAELVAAKLQAPLAASFVMAVFCGMLMYLAVDIYRTRTGVYQLVGIFVAVPVFILAGFEHSIANMFYLAAGWGAAAASIRTLLFLLVVTVGNAAGSVLLPAAKSIKSVLED